MNKYPFLLSTAMVFAVAFTLSPLCARAQTLYVSSGSRTVEKVTSTGATSVFATLPANSFPRGVAFDGGGNLFVVTPGFDVHGISKITPGGAVSTYANLSPFANAEGLAIADSGNLYTTTQSTQPDNSILEIGPGGAVSIYSTPSGAFSLTGLAFDTSGNLYAGESGHRWILKISPAGAASIFATLPSGSSAAGLVFDHAGNLLVTTTSATILKFTPDGTSSSVFATSGLFTPGGLALDNAGNVYVANLGNNSIEKFTPAGVGSAFATTAAQPRYVAITDVSPKAVRAVGFVTAIPGGTGNFTELRGAGLSGNLTAFYGAGSGGQKGIYRADRVSHNGPPIKVADTTTAIPSGTGNFTSFIPPNPIAPAIGDSSVAFYGAGSGGQQGIYGTSVSASGPPIKVADTATAIPGGSGNFLAFPTEPAVSGSHAAFAASGSGAQQGIYFANDVLVQGLPIKVADTATAIPGGTGNFTSFIPPNPVAPAISDSSVAFFGAGSGGQQGIYSASVIILGNPVKVADTATAIPGGIGNFTSFIPPNPVAPAIDGASVAFFGAGSGGQQGVYVSKNGPLIKIADTSTAIPGGTGNFTSFGNVSLSATDVAFLGNGSGGQQGIYDLTAGSLVKVVDLTDILNGRAITSLEFARNGLSGDPVAFQATFADGSQGIYTANVGPLRITAEKSGNDLRLSFNSELGVNYAIQSRADLSSGTWATLSGTTNSGTGGTLQQTLTNAFAQPQQFYRVQQLQ